MSNELLKSMEILPMISRLSSSFFHCSVSVQYYTELSALDHISKPCLLLLFQANLIIIFAQGCEGFAVIVWPYSITSDLSVAFKHSFSVSFFISRSK